MYKSENPLLALPDELVAQINQVTEHQIDALIQQVLYRFGQLRPDVEGAFLALSTDPEQRQEQIKNILTSLENQCRGSR